MQHEFLYLLISLVLLNPFVLCLLMKKAKARSSRTGLAELDESSFRI